MKAVPFSPSLPDLTIAFRLDARPRPRSTACTAESPILARTANWACVRAAALRANEKGCPIGPYIQPFCLTPALDWLNYRGAD